MSQSLAFKHSAPLSASLASGAISSASADLTQLCMYMLDTHVYQPPSSPSVWGTFPASDQVPSPLSNFSLDGRG